MIIQADIDTINQMVGPDRFKGGYPESFVKEYEMRIGMLHRCSGHIGPLGPVGIMHLLRDFDVSPTGQPKFEDVSDWRNVEPDTVIYYRGDRGVFKSVGENGVLFVKMDGHRPQWEVRAEDVRIRTVPEAEKEEGAAERMDDGESDDQPRTEPTEDEVMFGNWIVIEAQTQVIATIDGEEVEAEFVDISEDGKTIDLHIDGEVLTVEAKNVQLPVEA